MKFKTTNHTDLDFINAKLSHIIKSQISKNLNQNHYEPKQLKKILDLTNKSCKSMEA